MLVPESSPPPFTRLSHRVLVENRWHRYCHDRYTRRDGTAGDYYFVDMPGSCGIVPLFDDGTTVLLEVRRYLLRTTLWEFSIGGMLPGQDPVDVARHELAEEAGLAAGRMDLLGRFAPYKGVSNEVCHFFLARDLTDCGQALEPEEDIVIHRIDLAEAGRRLLAQPLGDGQSICGWMLLQQYLNARA